MARPRKTEPMPVQEPTAPIALIEKQVGPETCGKCHSQQVQTYATTARGKETVRYHRCRRCGHVFQTNRPMFGLQSRPPLGISTR